MAKETFSGIRRQLCKKVQTSDGRGFTTEPDGYETGTVEVSVDLRLIASQLGTRAMGNKSGLAKFMHGAVIVKVIQRSKAA